ncbi:MAG: aspartate aminotransferase family protein, partial [Elusimicrobia bacterium]|nr:aspartate aminotransferase family protein [Elusimicrobiota bacterium]
SMFTLFFTGQPVADYSSSKSSNTRQYSRFFHSLLQNKIYFPPSQFEAAFISTAHTNAILEKSSSAILNSLSKTFSR